MIYFSAVLVNAVSKVAPCREMSSLRAFRVETFDIITLVQFHTGRYLEDSSGWFVVADAVVLKTLCSVQVLR